MALIGVGTLFFTSIVNAIMPKIGLAVHAAAASSSYTPVDYQIDFLFVNLIAVGLIIFGVLLGYRFYKNDIL